MARETNARLAEILACPVCRQSLRREAERLVCAGGEHHFRHHDGVPVFIAETPVVAPLDHASNPIGPEFEAILREGREFVLNIGAGATAIRSPNCIEFEYKIFRHTDVVGDAHALPFRDDTFDRVFAFNVFEHLRDPRTAAAEIRRVLKPGGSVAIHTAFLQSLHEAPHHYYNATEFGVREWFAAFEIDSCSVSGNFGPGVMLSFLLSNVLHTAAQSGLSAREQFLLGDSSLQEWADFWRHRGEPPPGFAALQNLAPELQGAIAAGFQLLARKPAR